jgi:hypothetical protein
MVQLAERSLRVVALRLARTTLTVVVTMESTLGGASRPFDLIGIRLDSLARRDDSTSEQGVR